MFSRAYAGLANVWIGMTSWWGVYWADFTSCINMAEPAAKKALELGPESAEAHLAMAQVHYAVDRFDEARFKLEKAIRINPNLAEANNLLGQISATFGRFEEAIAYCQKARSLDPLDPYSVTNFIPVLRVAGKVDEALDIAEGLKDLHRKSPRVYNQTALCYLQKKDFAKALDALDIGQRFDPDDHWLKVIRGVAYALLGRREEAMDELRDLMKDEADSHRLNAQFWIGMAVGDLDRAFEALMRQAEIHSWYFTIKFDPLFEVLRKDPRFSEFCKKVGLPP